MLEVNRSFFILLLNFLVLLYVLNIILFKPFLRIFTDRESATKGAFDAAKDMGAKTNEALQQINHDIQNARDRARALYEEIIREGLKKQKDMLDDANNQAHSFIERAGIEIKADTERARLALRSDIGEFSDIIVKKLIGT